MPSHLEIEFDQLWESLFPQIDLETEVRLVENRRFRVDYVHKPSKVVIEINGGTWSKMGHSSGRGLNRDYEKLNLLQLQGYRVFQLSSDMITPHWLGLIAKTITKN